MRISLLYPGPSISSDNGLPQNLPLDDVLNVNVWREVHHCASEFDSLLATTCRVSNFPAALASDSGLTLSLTYLASTNRTIPAS
jgi:hypothetical protein